MKNHHPKDFKDKTKKQNQDVPPRPPTPARAFLWSSVIFAAGSGRTAEPEAEADPETDGAGKNPIETR
jgi:hypothetical protein